ncbi:hypothetical protein BSL78_24169 [Apostichopus japonicus]|uniref:Uncharacterized protein n=1 Tax=Stichopus japonicus TaxID=307972 RepID=A0A2G8JTA1_STIJA|nr:hypothetical protein BSL78_24169 [Apostichopus japonicus]
MSEKILYLAEKCGNSTGRIIGPRSEDGTLHITNTGVLVFNNITMNDSANYQLVYIDCDGGSYPQYIDNFNISVHNEEEPTIAPSESSTTSSQPNTSGEKNHSLAIWVIIAFTSVVIVLCLAVIIFKYVRTIIRQHRAGRPDIPMMQLDR